MCATNVRDEINLQLTKRVLWKLELMLSKNILPQILAMVGSKRAPHKIRVADTGSLIGGTS